MDNQMSMENSQAGQGQSVLSFCFYPAININDIAILKMKVQYGLHSNSDDLKMFILIYLW